MGHCPHALAHLHQLILAVSVAPSVCAQAMLQRSRETLEELHHVCGPKIGRYWADPSLSLAQFGVLRSLTLREIPELVTVWLSRLPVSLERRTIDVAPRSEAAAVLEKPSAVWEPVFSRMLTCARQSQ